MADNGPIPCWPNGHGTRRGDCDETIPDSSYETTRRFGWGIVQARDDFSPGGTGPFLACPEHRDFCTEEQREAARALNRAAKSDSP